MDWIPTEEFLKSAERLPVIDVRSPSEFSQGHIPGAFNIPLFNDGERAIVGTLYSKSGRDASVLKGLELAGPKLAGFIRLVNPIAPGRKVLVHCWRGGMRSESMAWLFEKAGLQTSVLRGGYKAYRKFIREQFSRSLRLAILGGLTGSGKTEILFSMAEAGEQVIDLEGLAHHKGSVFGSLGQLPQPTNEQFENDLSELWRALDKERMIWLEDESRMIGNVTLPEPLFALMNSAPLIRIQVPRQDRINRLVRDYAGFPKESLQEAIQKIREKLGGTRFNLAMEALEKEDYATVASLSLEYYDKAYEHSVLRRANPQVISLSFDSSDIKSYIASIRKVTGSLIQNKKI